MNGTVRRLALVVAVFATLAGGLLLTATAVFAHANFVRAEPAPNTVASTAPAEVVIWFTEPLAETFSTIQVLDATGRRVDRGDNAVAPDDATRLSVSLEPLPDGTYTVAWRNVSTVDGHALRGSYVFFVGEPGEAAPLPASEDTPLFFARGEPVARWIALLGALAVVGGLGFQWTVLRPVLTVADTPEATRRAGVRITAATLRLVWLALAVFVAASIAHLAVQTAAAADVPLHRVFGQPVRAVLSSTDWGRFWMWRMALLAGAAVVLAVGDASRRPRALRPRVAPLGRLAALAFALGALLTLSLTSHGAATANISDLAVFADYLHLLAAAVWVGGLFALLLALRVTWTALSPSERRPFLAALASRFSTLAMLSVGVLVVTGLYSAWAQVTVLRPLTTPYGWTLLAKLALVAMLLPLGALNLLWVRPRLGRDDRAARWLRRLVAGEVALAVLVVLAVGILTSLEPARQTASREQARAGATFEETVEGTTITVTVKPGTVGANRVLVELADRRGDPIDDASNVGLRLRYVGADLGATFLTAEPVGGGSYVADSAVLSIEGSWQLEVEVRRPDAFDARTAFRFDTASPGGGGSAAISPSAETGRLLWAWQLVALGGLALSVARFGWPGRAGRPATVAGAAVALVGVVLVVSAGGHLHLGGAGSATSAAVNPFAPDVRSLEIGGEVFTSSCQACHGATGRGDGPAAAGLSPPPADLSVHVPLHSDADNFGFVRNGIPGAAMPPFDDLSDEQIWHLLNYLQTLR